MIKNNLMENINAKAFKQRPRTSKRTKCNLCNSSFPAKSKFDRFCSKCKEENDVYAFADYFEEARIMN